MLSRAQAASLLGSVRPSRAQAADWAAWPNRTEPQRPGWATEQAEPSMQATEPSPSGGSARFARFDYRPVDNATMGHQEMQGYTTTSLVCLDILYILGYGRNY